MPYWSKHCISLKGKSTKILVHTWEYMLVQIFVRVTSASSVTLATGKYNMWSQHRFQLATFRRLRTVIKEWDSNVFQNFNASAQHALEIIRLTYKTCVGGLALLARKLAKNSKRINWQYARNMPATHSYRLPALRGAGRTLLDGSESIVRLKNFGIEFQEIFSA